MTGVKEECIYALCLGLAEDNTIPTKPSISKQQSPAQEKQEAINQKALSETMLQGPIKSNPHLNQRKEGEQRKKGDSTSEGRKGIKKSEIG